MAVLLHLCTIFYCWNDDNYIRHKPNGQYDVAHRQYLLQAAF